MIANPEASLVSFEEVCKWLFWLVVCWQLWHCWQNESHASCKMLHNQEASGQSCTVMIKLVCVLWHVWHCSIASNTERALDCDVWSVWICSDGVRACACRRCATWQWQFSVVGRITDEWHRVIVRRVFTQWHRRPRGRQHFSLTHTSAGALWVDHWHLHLYYYSCRAWSSVNCGNFLSCLAGWSLTLLLVICAFCAFWQPTDEQRWHYVFDLSMCLYMHAYGHTTWHYASAVYAVALCLSVCLSVTSWSSAKMVKHHTNNTTW